MPREKKGSQEKKSKGEVVPPIAPITAAAFPHSFIYLFIYLIISCPLNLHRYFLPLCVYNLLAGFVRLSFH